MAATFLLLWKQNKNSFQNISNGFFGFQNRKCPLRYAKLHDFEKNISRAILASDKRNVNFQSAYKVQSCV